jgi:putative acyl-CoA dehydrogenase
VRRALGAENQTPSLAWNNTDQQTAHAARCALPFLLNQVDCGVNCPLTMTYAAVPALRNTPSVADAWVPKLIAPHYDGR